MPNCDIDIDHSVNVSHRYSLSTCNDETEFGMLNIKYLSK